VGYILLGPKTSGDMYAKQDIKTLEIISSECSVGILRAQGVEEIKNFNITLQEEIKKATSDLQDANEHLKELDKLKDEFLSVASHDLRTPMTAMKGYLYLMLKHISDMPPDMAEKLRRIYNSAERLIALINDMLDVSRIESGRMQLSPEIVDLRTVTLDVLTEIKGLADDKDITITVEEGKYPVFADKAKLHEVIVNLIGNAIKFTPNQGTIRIFWKAEGDTIETSVQDSGIGIKEEDIPKLFSKFGRIDTSHSAVSAVGGTGLGLFIVKRIIELSGGSLGVQSEEGKGSRFWFRLQRRNYG
jgi:signal transduction histidine kinase